MRLQRQYMRFQRQAPHQRRPDQALKEAVQALEEAVHALEEAVHALQEADAPHRRPLMRRALKEALRTASFERMHKAVFRPPIQRPLNGRPKHFLFKRLGLIKRPPRIRRESQSQFAHIYLCTHLSSRTYAYVYTSVRAHMPMYTPQFAHIYLCIHPN